MATTTAAITPVPAAAAASAPATAPSPPPVPLRAPADMLAGQALRPTTPVPGLWLLDCPDTVYVRVYGAPPLVEPDAAPAAAAAPEESADISASAAPSPAPPPATASAHPSPHATPTPAPAPAHAAPASPTPAPPPRSPAASLHVPSSPAVARSPATLQLPRSRAGTPAAAASGTPAANGDGGRSRQPSPARSSAGATGAPARPPSPSSTLARLRSDPLERAWLALNADGDVPSAVLAAPCAVVRPGDRRELWVFSPHDTPPPALDSLGLTGDTSAPSPLMAELDAPPPIRIADTVSCPRHGHALSCLTVDEPDADDDDARACVPTFTPPDAWSLLEAAVGEKLAWRLGTRIALLPCPATLGDPPFAVSVRPAPTGLVLRAHARPVPYCAPAPRDAVAVNGVAGGPPVPASGIESGTDPVVLRPLALPALLVAPHSPTAAQDVRIGAAFDAALGATWKIGRTEARVAARAAGAPAADWSIYWVPLRCGADVAGSLPGALAARWRGADGVLTVWPTHLVRPLARDAAPAKPRATPPPDVTAAAATAATSGLGAPPDLLAAAAGVFDFFATYTAPSEDEEDDAEPDGDDAPEPEPEPDHEHDHEHEHEHDQEHDHEADGDPADADAASELDDLFSSHTSPAPSASRASRAPTVATDAGELFPSSTFASPRAMDMDEDLFGDDGGEAEAEDKPDAEAGADAGADASANTDAADTRDTLMLPPPVPAQTQQSSRATSPRNLPVTEDDFNFFDSPAADMSPTKTFSVDVGADDAVAEPVFEGPHPSIDDHTGKELPTPALPPESLPDITMDLPSVPEEEEEEVVVVVEAAPPSPDVPVPVKRRYVDLVPEAFAPVDLGKRKRARFAYGLPSPVAPVSTLRMELVERLRRATAGPANDKYDYASAWGVESDESDSDDESAATTGAPPTPESTESYDDGTPAPRSPPAAPPVPADDEVEYDGALCVGGEWTSLQYDAVAAGALARAWGSAWANCRAARTDLPTPPRSPAAAAATEDTLAALDVDALANAVVRNRFFRELFERARTPDPARAPFGIVKSGVALSDITAAIAEEATYALPQADVNVGYGASVLRLSVAALRYWRELGLAPAGGPKDVNAFVVCEPGDGATRRARAFLDDMREVYAAHRLGTMSTGSHESASDGVVAAAPADAGSVITRMRAAATTPTLIFVLMSSGSVSPASLAPLLAAPSHTSWIYALPIGAARAPANLAAAAMEAYDLVPRRIHRVTMFGKPLDLPGAYMAYHAFTLAPREPAPRPELSMAWPQRSYDVLNRWRPIHAAYTYLPRASVLVVATVDSAGDACDVRAIRLEPGATSPRDRVARAWDAITSFAKVAATEWRASVTSLGLMSPDELDAWKSIAAAHRDPLTLLMSEPPAPGQSRIRAPVANIPPSTFADPAASIVDESLAASSAQFTHRLAVELGTEPAPTGAPAADVATPKAEGPAPSGSAIASPSPSPPRTVFPPASFALGVATASGADAQTTVYHVMMHRAPPARNDTAAQLLAPEFHRLTCLARRRYGLGTLPLHLDAVRVAAQALERVAAGNPDA